MRSFCNDIQLHRIVYIARFNFCRLSPLSSLKSEILSKMITLLSLTKPNYCTKFANLPVTPYLDELIQVGSGLCTKYRRNKVYSSKVVILNLASPFPGSYFVCENLHTSLLSLAYKMVSECSESICCF